MMRSLFFLGSLLFIFSCNHESELPSDSVIEKKAQEIVSTYSDGDVSLSDFEKIEEKNKEKEYIIDFIGKIQYNQSGVASLEKVQKGERGFLLIRKERPDSYFNDTAYFPVQKGKKREIKGAFVYSNDGKKWELSRFIFLINPN